MDNSLVVQKAEVAPRLHPTVLLPGNRSFGSGKPLWLISANRNRATEGYPLHLAPYHARILCIGAHDFLPMTAAAWVSEENKIIVAVESDLFDAGRDVLIRIWTLNSTGISRLACFNRHGNTSLATAKFEAWDGLPVSGVALFPLSKAGEEC